MNKDFGDWLRKEINASGSSQVEFAEKVNITQSHLSRILSGDRGASNELLENISIVLGKPVEMVMRRAGFLHSKPLQDEKIDEALHILSMLETDDLEEIIQIARLKLEREKAATKKSRSIRPARNLLKDK